MGRLYSTYLSDYVAASFNSYHDHTKGNRCNHVNRFSGLWDKYKLKPKVLFLPLTFEYDTKKQKMIDSKICNRVR